MRLFNRLSRLGRAYRKLPEHHNFAELADNIDAFANHLLDRAIGKNFGGESYLNAPNTWEWKLGRDLKTLVEYARSYVPKDVDGLHRTRRD
ncbi:MULTISPECIES: hypothetical protein [Bradyrhizobium]|uniref:hypothetical protein n=1 Tax=Bradyrhizobium TaxID=374 RepID=UPI0013E89B86|nr:MULTISPECIES: hypothetical protein [Bradyrhizobium]